MSVSEKIKTKNKAQYNLDRQTAEILALSWGNVGKYEFLNDKYDLSEKDLFRKNCYNRKIWISTIQ